MPISDGRSLSWWSGLRGPVMNDAVGSSKLLVGPSLAVRSKTWTQTKRDPKDPTVEQADEEVYA